MYGNDGSVNGYMTASPSTGNPFYITAIVATTQLGSTGNPLYQLTTNILTNDSTFYGYNFTRWILRVAYTGTTSSVTPPNSPTFAAAQPVNQTFEILSDITNAPSGNRTFLVDLLDPWNNTASGKGTTTLLNPTNTSAAQLPAYYLVNSPNPDEPWQSQAPSPSSSTAVGSMRSTGPVWAELAETRPGAISDSTEATQTRPAWTRITTPATWKTGSWRWECYEQVRW